MNRINFSSLFFSSLILASFATIAVAELKLVWQDEFDGDSLDTSKWQYENHCSPQNNELQCYTNRKDNVYVKNGALHVRAKPENYGNKKYTSGRINTKHSAAWKYGRFDIRAKLPKGNFLWPALWMLPRDYVYGGWAASGEIDIMEARGQLPNQVSNALHYGGAWPNNAHVGSGAMNFNADFTADFHLFSAIWERDQIQFLVDGKVVTTQSLTRNWFSGKGKNPYTEIRQPFDQPFFFLINVAVGGNFFGDQSQALTTAVANNWASPELIVDYVRVYQESTGGPIVGPVPVPTPTKATVATIPKPSSAIPKTEATAPKVSTTPKHSETVPKTQQTPSTTNSKPATPAPSSPCNGKCGGEGCCNDHKLGVVCYNQNAYSCLANPNGKLSLCGKGLGVCNSVCFDTKNYKCVNGAIQQS
jgi:beta-glucanase (GH16 family)